MLSVNISPLFIKSRLSSPPIETYRPFGDPYRFFKAQIRSVGVPYFEWPDIEHDAMRKLLLIKQDTE